MKKIAMISAALSLLTAGCTTSVCRHYETDAVTGSSGRPAVAVVKGMNCGYFLFYWIPLWSGTPHRPNENEWDLWMNQVRERDIRRMLNQRASLLGADDVDDLKIRETSRGWWTLWIVWRRTISGSGIAVRDPRLHKEKKTGKKRLFPGLRTGSDPSEKPSK
ncbi:MAG: hypothetical protein IJS01_10800 [Lentisphaeria bacterium]|nr:hypothetical protein [Lentisphaeria bacterium]